MEEHEIQRIKMEHVMSPPQPYLPPKKNNIKTMVLP